MCLPGFTVLLTPIQEVVGQNRTLGFGDHHESSRVKVETLVVRSSLQ